MTATDIFYYDGDCGLCTKTVRWLAERSDGSVSFVPASDESRARHGLMLAETERAAILVSADGRRWEGSEAIGEVLRRSPKYDTNLAGRLLLEWPSREIAGWVYGWVARNRYRLSGDHPGAVDRPA